jgi:cobalt-zinc-cadmium efflux system outer membrane protein
MTMIHGKRIACVLLLAAGAGNGPDAQAAERFLSFTQAAERSAQNPRLQAGQQAQQGLARAASRVPRIDANPVLTVQLGGRVSPARERNPEGQVALTQTLSLEGAARLRREALAAEARTAQAQQRQLQVMVRLEAARAWLDLWSAQQLHQLAQQDAEAAARLRKAVEALVTARERPRSEALVARRQAQAAALRVLEAEGALAESRALLQAELGLPLEDTPVATGDPPELLPPSEQAQRAALASAAALPSVRTRTLLAAEERVRAAEERAARGTRLTFGVQAQRDALGATVLQGILGLPLPVMDVASREEAPRLAAALRADGDAADALHRAQADLALAFHDLEHSEQVASALQDALLPAAEEALQALEKELRAGEATLLEALEGRRALIEARQRKVVAERERAWARLRAVALVAALQEPSP